MITERTWQITPFASPLGDDSEVERLALVDPANLYTELAPLSVTGVDATWRSAWSLLGLQGFHMSLLQTQTSFRWDLGLTRARPGVEMPLLHSFPELGKPWVAANIVKAGIDRDLFTQAQLLAGPGNALLAANLAVAAQLLREKLAAARASGETYSGLWSGPLEHMMAARRAFALTDVETSYLMRLLENELSSRREVPPSAYGYRQVPTAVRVARAAAAYQSKTYKAPFPCANDGVVVTAVAAASLADATRPFCFADMIDRRVLAWYGAALRDDLAEKREDPDTMASAAAPLIKAVDRLHPAWLGAFVGDAPDASLDTEVVSATTTRELVWQGRVRAATLDALEELAADRLCRGSAL
ncbi:MAG TPA: hypothetical protein VM621_06650 [Luteibacter sp.]|uniref:hypothetical protein n=1 Tax=Luteibacter sp. TaxID=1886636 RepID=UPI002CD11C68|nr:hypothetical protein [Luteibacter sp.]HVI54715.1 hypothetical protein [Luteibacter sp.]